MLPKGFTKKRILIMFFFNLGSKFFEAKQNATSNNDNKRN